MGTGKVSRFFERNMKWLFLKICKYNRERSLTSTYFTPKKRDTNPVPMSLLNVASATETSTTLYKASKWKTEICNDSSISDQVSRTVNRRIWADFSLGVDSEAEANFGIVTGTVGYSAEASLGVDTEDSVSYTWNIPGDTITKIDAGSKAVKTNGEIVKYSRGIAYERTLVDADYSRMEYADKNSMNYYGTCPSS
ncbi:hypothetical protein [Aquibacillus salsiterrae]|uniref:Uncharacterized protein n=1 Tax=Aquibacillus salsiterrae TaxID=2950439 RepID=A0A9X3WB57_9BACI|nr:hypothetical protein [Aquibacillus salsiterrae]MDC3416240.1 hypothetical protein [Aquibacillus salsiterrae]